MRGLVMLASGVPVSGAQILVYASVDASGPASPCAPRDRSTALFAEDCAAAADTIASLLAEGRLEALPVASAESGADGAFELSLPAGTYDLYAEVPDRSAGAVLQVESGTDPAPIVLDDFARLTGLVRDGSTDAPLSGAEVVIATARPLRVFRTRSGPAGTFAARAPALPPYGFFVRARGFAPFVESSEDTEAAIDLERSLRIFGRVLQDGRGAPDAEVEHEESGRKTRTDAQGGFTFDGVGCAHCTIAARSSKGVGSAAVDPPDGPTAEVEIVLLDAGTLNVKILDEATREPVIDASADAGGENPIVLSFVEKGLFSATHVARGSYQVSAGAPGYVAKAVGVRVDGNVETSVEILLRRGLELRGRVVDGEGRPVAEALVGAKGPLGVFESAETGEDGAFVIVGLDTGPVSMAVEHASFVTEEVGDKLPQREPVTIRLRRAAALSVQVVDPQGRPVEGALVRLTAGSKGPQVAAGTSEDDGRTRLDRLLPGKYVARATAHDYVESAEAPVEVLLETEAAARLVLRQGLSLSGIVVDDRGTPVHPALVHCATRTTSAGSQAGGQKTDWARTTSDGRFTLAGLMPGTYALVADGEGSEQGDFTEPVVVSAGAEQVRLVIGRPGTIAGRVVESGRAVQRFFAREVLVQSAQGQFTLTAVPGLRTVLLTGDFVPVSVKARVESGKTTDVGDVPVHGGGAIEGLALRGGVPVVGLTVQARPVDSPGTQLDEASAAALAGASETTLADGRFRLAHLPAGRYRLSAHGPEGVVLPVEVAAAAGRTERVSLSVMVGGRILGVVKHGRGGPAARTRVSVLGEEMAITAVTDSEGGFAVEGLLPGRYRIFSATAARPGTPMREVDVALGREVRVDLTAAAE